MPDEMGMGSRRITPSNVGKIFAGPGLQPVPASSETDYLIWALDSRQQSILDGFH